MRASSLSNEKVISLINRYFVPVYTSNEDFRAGGSAPAEERKTLQHIVGETLKAKLSAGTVHVYLLTPDGQSIDSQHVATASKVDKLTEMLERAVARLKLPEGEPLVTPASQSKAPKAESDALVLHLVARTVTRKGNEDIVRPAKLGETRSVGWGAYPAENWIVLSKGEWSRLLPAEKVAPGMSWNLDREVVSKVLTHVYPSTENNNIASNKIEEQSLTARVIAEKDGIVRARLDGHLRMKHSFYHKEDGNFVDADLVGLLEFAPGQGIRSLQLVTSRATYGRTNFGVVIRNVR
jgi:hypothetical protein